MMKRLFIVTIFTFLFFNFSGNCQSKVFAKDGVMYIVDVQTGIQYEGIARNVLVVRSSTTSEDFYFRNINGWNDSWFLNISNIQDENGVVYSLPAFISFSEKLGVLQVENVRIENNTSPSFDLFFVEPLGSPTTLVNPVSLDDRDIELTDATNFDVGTWVGVFSGAGRYLWAECIEKNGNVLTLDRLIDFPFQGGSNVLPTSRNLGVDGSVTPRIFSIQAGSAGLEIDVTRLIISMVTTNPIELDLFGDQPSLTRGLLLRKVNSEYRNLINTKTNYEIGVHSYDIAVYEQIKQNDLNAFLARSTWAGTSKRGTAIRLKPGEELQLVVQDDLSGIINILILAQGHEVE